MMVILLTPVTLITLVSATLVTLVSCLKVVPKWGGIFITSFKLE